MNEGRSRWAAAAGRKSFLAEAFLTLNLAFLALDIYVAHSVNAFRHPAEWIPFVFTIAAALALLVNLALSSPVRRGPGRRQYYEGAGRTLGLVVGALAVMVGVAGLIWHLESEFFKMTTLRSLVYSAPFVAPLAFTGLGLLALLNRLVPHDAPEWGLWVLFLAWGGFVGNFILSLADHAQNGFFYATEWIPVGVAALVVGWLIVPILTPTPPRYLQIGGVLLLFAALTGVAGLFFHLAPVFNGEGGALADRIIHGAPVFAPLLFPNLAALAALGLWDLRAKGHVTRAVDPEPVVDRA